MIENSLNLPIYPPLYLHKRYKKVENLSPEFLSIPQEYQGLFLDIFKYLDSNSPILKLDKQQRLELLKSIIYDLLEGYQVEKMTTILTKVKPYFRDNNGKFLTFEKIDYWLTTPKFSFIYSLQILADFINLMGYRRVASSRYSLMTVRSLSSYLAKHLPKYDFSFWKIRKEKLQVKYLLRGTQFEDLMKTQMSDFLSDYFSQ